MGTPVVGRSNIIRHSNAGDRNTSFQITKKTMQLRIVEFVVVSWWWSWLRQWRCLMDVAFWLSERCFREGLGGLADEREGKVILRPRLYRAIVWA